MKRSLRVTVRISPQEYAEASAAAYLLDITLSQAVRQCFRAMVLEARSRGGYYGGRPVKGSRVQAVWDALVDEHKGG